MNDRLEQIEARTEAATKGPWRTGGSGVVADREYIAMGIRTDPDASFIAHAREDVPYLLALVREQQAQIERVTALHVREVLAVHEGYGEEAWCPNCRVHWPCPASAALTATEVGK